MSHHEDIDYFRRRAAEELKRVDESTNMTARAVHYELAERYGTLAGETRSRGPKLSLVDDGGINSPTDGDACADSRLRISSSGPPGIPADRLADRESDKTLVAPM